MNGSSVIVSSIELVYQSCLSFYPFEKSTGRCFHLCLGLFKQGTTHTFCHTSICHCAILNLDRKIVLWTHDEWNEDSPIIQALYLVFLGTSKGQLTKVQDKKTSGIVCTLSSTICAQIAPTCVSNNNGFQLIGLEVSFDCW